MNRHHRPEEHQADSGHHYAAIHLSGNARAIIGNVYGGNNGLLLDAFDLDLEVTGQGHNSLQLGQFAITILGHYAAVKASVEAYRSSNTKIGKCVKQLQVRHTIFQHALCNLLLPYSGVEVAQQMLVNSQHSNWADPGFAVYLQERFHGSMPAMKAAMDLIRLDLNAIAQIGQKCGMSRKEILKVRERSTAGCTISLSRSAPSFRHNHDPPPANASIIDGPRTVCQLVSPHNSA